MVVVSMDQSSKTRQIPVIDLSLDRPLISQHIVKICEEFGFFKVINHRVPPRVSAQLEAAGGDFFNLPAAEKQQAGPPNPLGYGCRTIGLNGDIGEIEYLLLPVDTSSVSQTARIVCKKDPNKFSCVVKEYLEAMKKLAGEILELIEEGLGLGGSGVLCKLIKGSGSDSLLRLNHYPSNSNSNSNKKDKDIKSRTGSKRKGRESSRIGFGEHTDPQILTLLRSNGIGGLQILAPVSGGLGGGKTWVAVPPDPTAVFINVGDALQAMTNGRLVSVRHRAMTNSYKSRMSIIYFAAPELHTWITPLPDMITADNPRRYKSFTWAEYKKAMYSLKLGQNRLDRFKIDTREGDAQVFNHNSLQGFDE
ncbi:gibberellin 2-beta-dioxygenase 2-like [Phalaenopsis equestris]|uniref:gibberellin 2-beta-dioxygenase 2-like n=1 Tax=Phalaenopsis equestris TaxID=78828 RepID=UPI0009E4FE03|nr:gibberellin 2-beta-dioxygenase 2-like [Phalaenopsis equestris]